MARRLQALILDLGLTEREYRYREAQAVGAPGLSDSDALEWLIPEVLWGVGDDDTGARFLGTRGDRFAAGVQLTRASSGKWTTDTDYDTGTNGPRTVQSPRVEAAGVRSWVGLELKYNAEGSGTSALFRIVDIATGDQLYWDGGDWVAGTAGDDTVAEWSTAQVAQDNFGSLPHNVRKLAILCWLRTSSATATPRFYGARLAYGVRQVDSLDDALKRTLLKSLRDELRAIGVDAVTTSETTASFQIAGTERAYEVTAVSAVFNTTADPDELTELPGTFDAGPPATWTPTTPIASGQTVRIEFDFRPDLVVRRHMDLATLAKLPALYLAPSGPPAAVHRAPAPMVLRDLNASPPTAIELSAPETVSVPLEIRIVAELENDANRLRRELARWFTVAPDGQERGRGRRRVLLSPETGQTVSVRMTSLPVPTPQSLAQGVAEARAVLLLTFQRATAETTTTATLARSGGITVETQEKPT